MTRRGGGRGGGGEKRRDGNKDSGKRRKAAAEAAAAAGDQDDGGDGDDKDKVGAAGARGTGIGSCVAVHVRRGDACGDTRGQRMCHATAEYASAARQLAERYDLRSAFVATDDAAALRELRAALEPDGIAVHALSMQRSWYTRKRKGFDRETRIEERLRCGEANRFRLPGAPPGTAVGFAAALEVEFMRRCDAFVGTLSSSLGRTALELMAARMHRVPPYVSLDFAWCAGHDGTLDVAHHSSSGGGESGAGAGKSRATEKRKLVC